MSTEAMVRKDPAAQRVTALERAFRALAKSDPTLEVDVVGRVTGQESLVHPTAGFRVCLCDGENAGVALYISANYGELTRWLGPRPEGPGAVRERFEVDLTAGFEWGDSEFPDGAALAHDLVAYMQYNLDAMVF